MRRVHFAIPGDLATNTGGYVYDRRVIAELRAAGWDVVHVALPGGFPLPDAAVLAEAGQTMASIPYGALVLVDGLAFGAMPAIAEREAGRLRMVALVHHPLALETGLDAATAAQLRDSEMRALATARGVIATSRTTAGTLAAGFGIAESRLCVAPPGTDPAPRSSGSKPPLISSVGTLTPRKGHDVLIRALGRIADLDWNCRIIGSAERDAAHAAELADMIGNLELGSRVTLVGEAGEPRAELARADIFALASHYEGYGMVFAEALQQGVPVIGCRAGAVPEVVPDGAGVLVAPGDEAALADALRRLLADPARRRAMADAAYAAGRELPGWRATAALISDGLEVFGR